MTLITPPVQAPTRSTDLATAVRSWAALAPRRPACTFLHFQGDDVTQDTVDYGELDRRARALAARLQQIGEPGDRIALLVRHGWEYVVAFLACLYTDRIGVPLYAVEAARNTERLTAVLDDARPVASLVAPGDVDGAESLRSRGAHVGELVVVDGSGDATRWTDPRVRDDQVSYLQYTSGSTRAPAGVVVTSRNLATGLGQLRAAADIGEGGPVVTWLPFFHDMGLVLSVATPLQAGGHVVSMEPLAFVQRPVRWLQAIGRFRGHTSATPNMGLDAAVHRVDESERADLDLSSLRVLANGAEPIRSASMEAFTAAYAPHGFRHEAHRPGYGLAEATLMVSTTRNGELPTFLDVDRAQLATGVAAAPAPDAPAEHAMRVVGCGRAIDQDLRVVDPGARTELPAGRVGELWIRGDNVCGGYYRRPEQTLEVFGAELADRPGDAWLRTGDLGFRHEQQVFVTARLKDLIIIGGKNHYPADVESTVIATEPAARRVAAFSVDGERGEELVAVAEIDPRRLDGFDPALSIRRVRAALSRQHQVEARDILLVPPGTIPRTTSGKIQRGACRQAYLAGSITMPG